MISKGEHQDIIRCISALGEFARAGCKDLVFMTDTLGKSTVAIMEAAARETRTTVQEVMRGALIKSLREERDDHGLGFVMGNPNMEAASLIKPEEPELPDEMAVAFREALKKARVFEIPRPSFTAILAGARDQARRDMLSGVRRHHGPEWAAKVDRLIDQSGEIRDEEKVRQYRETLDRMDAVFDEMKGLPLNVPAFEDGRPFDACLFFSSQPIVTNTGRPHSRPLTGVLSTFGVLISEEFVCLLEGTHADTFFDFRPSPLRFENTWLGSSYGFAPRLCNAFFNLVNEHGGVLEERKGLGEKMTLEQLRKRGVRMPAPSPFYVINIGDGFVKEHRKSVFPAQPREWSHRWDVRRHTMVKVLRGKGSVDERARKRLEKRGYKIYEADEPTADVLAELARRRIPLKQEDEWMAVLIRWRRPYIKGPEGKPYTPAVRRVPEEKKE